MTAPALTRRSLAGHLYHLEPLLLPSGAIVAVLVAWEVAARTELISPFFFSSPSEIVVVGGETLASADFWSDVWVSTQEFIVGYVAAVAMAVPFGFLTGWFRYLHHLFEPWLAAFNATPRLALLPLVILWVGLGFWSKAVIVFLGVFFPVAMNTFHGIRSVDPNLHQVARSFGANRVRSLLSVVVPSVIPFTLIGMKLGIGRAVSGVVIAEYFTSEAGLGNFIFRAGAQLRTAEMLFGALFITTAAVAAFYALGLVERRIRGWQPGMESSQSPRSKA